jgi:hypothetical protein
MALALSIGWDLVISGIHLCFVLIIDEDTQLGIGLAKLILLNCSPRLPARILHSAFSASVSLCVCVYNYSLDIFSQAGKHLNLTGCVCSCQVPSPQNPLPHLRTQAGKTENGFIAQVEDIR